VVYTFYSYVFFLFVMAPLFILYLTHWGSINISTLFKNSTFPPTYQVPGPYCEYRQDSRLVGSTYPNAVVYVSTEDRRRSNVSLVSPNLCRLTWAPLADEKPFTYTCRVYQGSSWKENSMAVHHRILPICSAISVMFKSAPWFLSLLMSLPVAVGLLSP
uniref:Si:ch211-215c18.3 n=1 Tax=Sander lucioperca TaxID=283035 RepID=A0A8C9XZS5_SANLU